jgi:hypothetical protein
MVITAPSTVISMVANLSKAAILKESSNKNMKIYNRNGIFILVPDMRRIGRVNVIRMLAGRG